MADETNQTAPGGNAETTPESARSFLADFGHSADALKGMADPDVLKMHGAVSSGLSKHAPKPKPAGDWREAIKDEEARKFAETSPDVEHFTKRAMDMRQKLSSAVVRPGKDAKPEEIATYRKAMGVPDTPEGYKFEMPEGREPTEADKAFQAEWAKAFHADGVPQDIAAQINKRWNAFVAAAEKANKEADARFAEDSRRKLIEKWGGEQPYEENRKYAERGAAELFGPEIDNVRAIETKDGRFVLDHPAFVEAFAKVGRETSEDRTFGRIMSDSARQGAEARVKEIHGKIDEAMARNDHDTANKLDQELQEIHRKLSGSKPAVGTMGRAA